MMQKIFTVLSFVILAVQLHGGWIITEKTVYPDKTTYETLIYFQQNLVKSAEKNNVTIFDLERQQLTLLNLQTRTYWQGSLIAYKREVKEITLKRIQEELKGIPPEHREQYRELYENLVRDMDNPAPAFYADASIRLEMTTEQKTILGYNAKKYKLFVDGFLTEEIWLSSSIKVSMEVDLDKFRLFMNEMSLGNLEPDHRTSQEYLHLLKSGYPLFSREFTDEGEVVTEVVKAEKKQIPASEFGIPAGFKQVHLNTFGIF